MHVNDHQTLLELIAVSNVFLCFWISLKSPPFFLTWHSNFFLTLLRWEVNAIPASAGIAVMTKKQLTNWHQLTQVLRVFFPVWFHRSYNRCSCQNHRITGKGLKKQSFLSSPRCLCVCTCASYCACTVVYIESVNWVVIAIVCLIRGRRRPPSTLPMSVWECTCDTSSWQILRFLLTW